MRNKSRHRGKIKDGAIAEKRERERRGRDEHEAEQIEESAPHFTTDGDFMMHSSHLVLYLPFSYLGLVRSSSLVPLPWFLSKYIFCGTKMYNSIVK